jgi:hypothetical protein
MNIRSLGNGVCGTAGIVSLLGIAGWILKRLGYSSLGDLLALANVAGVEINWGGVWLVVFVASVVGLITINIDSLRQWRERQRAAKHRDWNMNLCDAIDYIAQTSMLGTAWPEGEMPRCRLSLPN